MSTIKTNTLTGTTSAGSINVTGEGGSNTTNLQQGLAKAWVKHSDAAALEDSYNIASGTDNGTGDYTFAFTSNMTNAEYAISGACLNASGNVPVVSWNPAEDEQTTSQFNVEQGYTISGGSYSNFDEPGSGSIHGDLA